MYSMLTFVDNEPPQEAIDFFVMSTRAFAEEIANWPEAKKYSEKIAKLPDHIYQILLDATKLSEDEFNVINHGDFHVNNVLFKYDNDGKPIDPIFVDFQECVYASPAVDLLFFFNTSLCLDVIENKRDILLNEYLSTLSATIKQLNCKTQPPSMEELKAILKRRAGYGMMASITILPMLLCSKTEATDLDEMMGTGIWINPGLKSENYKKIMLKKIPLFDKWGLLDF
ncbi:PREDICTED: uncharacterized protein LOC105461788 [Wasmannia auropunctata]|uniref:uncharacterized protein LOC105461788 n=1 Tax=Wasmannia auropunctata TaxID=64793 RepID=UPI0005F04AA8|nr:PREDICTED: uncharacterized protein LOC105461788 [Wasmannia auropunctata]